MRRVVLLENEDIQLGGQIVLSGFKDIKPAEIIVVKKLVGSYARKFSDDIKGYESLNLRLKEVHKTPGSEKYEIQAKLIHEGKLESSEVIERNIFVAVDSALKKLESQLMHLKNK